MSGPESIRSILIQHHQRYPGMQVQDFFKLIYQNEFASGHLVLDEACSLDCLKQELQSLRPQSPDGSKPADRFESIGNGLCRLNLIQIEAFGLELPTVNRFFTITAERVTGSSKGFQDKLRILKACMQDQVLPDNRDDLDSMMKNYDFSACPPISHSQAYRKAYAPAYRVVQAVFQEYAAVFCRIDLLLKSRRTINVAIDGFCGAGKSTLAVLLQRVYACNVIHMDHFFLPPALRTAERLMEPGGNIDYARFIEEVAVKLPAGEKFQYRAFDCKTGQSGQAITVAPNRINVIEGSYSMHPKIDIPYDLKIFLEIDAGEQIRRLQQRNRPDQLKRFIQEWIPMENLYFKKMQIIRQSDLVVRTPDRR